MLFAAGTGGILMHELVGHPVEADLALCGDSPLAALDGRPITAATIHIVDDPSRIDLPGAFSCDDEGTRATASDGRLGRPIWSAGCAIARAARRSAARPAGGGRSTWDCAPARECRTSWWLPGNTDSRGDRERPRSAGWW